jgi:lipopolysaccharide transport system ATP-binding protein
VDEVLAVGDAEFQKKCLGKMGEVARGGRTVLFVSHNMGAIQSLCSRAIHLGCGKLSSDGQVDTVVRGYLQDLESALTSGSLSDLPRSGAHGTRLRVVGCHVLDGDNVVTHTLRMGEPISVYINAVALDSLSQVSFVVGLDNRQGARITTAASEESGCLYGYEKGDDIELVARFEDLILNIGRYSVALSARIGQSGLDLVSPAAWFDVADVRHPRAQHMAGLWGDVRCTPRWEHH